MIVDDLQRYGPIATDGAVGEISRERRQGVDLFDSEVSQARHHEGAKVLGTLGAGKMQTCPGEEPAEELWHSAKTQHLPKQGNRLNVVFLIASQVVVENGERRVFR